MKVINNIPLRHYVFYDRARSRTDYLSAEELDKCEKILERKYPDGIEEDVLNDIFNHYFDEYFSHALHLTDDELAERKEKSKSLTNELYYQ